MMRRRRIPDWKTFTMYQSTATERLATGGKTVGMDIDIDQDLNNRSMYSRSLRNLIAECLLLTPANRPSPRELMRRTADGASRVQMSMGQILGPPLPQWQEPVVSAEWLQPNAGDPLAAVFGALEVKRRPPVKTQPVPNAPPAPTAQATTTQAGQAAQIGAAQPTATQASPARPLPVNANAIRTIRVIVQTKPKYGGIVAGGHKTFALRVTPATTVVQVKDMLERQRCGIKATSMNLMAGRTLMKNFQTLGEFPGVDNVRAMEY